MKKYIIIIFALTLLPMSIGAEITLRKGTRSTIIRTQQRVQPTNRNNFDAIYAIQPEKKNISYQHNSYTKPQKQVTQGYDVSYFSTGTQVKTSTKLHINNSNHGAKYYKYDALEVNNNSIGSVTTYKAPSLQPFNEDVKDVTTGSVQYAFGPPTEGPISDIIFPLLCFVCLYIVVKRKK